MKCQTLFVLFIFACLQAVSYADTTFVGGVVDGRWDPDGSPYILVELVEIERDAELIIEAGVEVLFSEGTAFDVNGSIVANGTDEDSIHFAPFQNSGFLMIMTGHEGAQRMEFNYCLFENLWDDRMAVLNLDSAEEMVIVRHCTFRECFTYAIETFTSVQIENCYFIGGYQAIKSYTVENDAIEIKNCYFDNRNNRFRNQEYVQLSSLLRLNGQTILENCYLRDVKLAVSGMVFVNENIFFNGRNIYITRPPVDVENPELDPLTGNNCFMGNPPFPFGVFAGQIVPDTITLRGILDRVNRNGDSTDVYGNLFMDPRIVDGWEWADGNFLMEDSPCIDAGDAEGGRDPDGTISDIGPFFFPQRNILVDTTWVEFTTPGIADTAIVNIINIGLDTLQLFSVQFADSQHAPFSLDGDYGEVVMSPGDTVAVGVIFAPPRAGDHAGLLWVISDDRDEDTVEVALVGMSLGVEGGNSFAPPTAFHLEPAYPNPFNSSAKISFQLAETLPVKISIVDATGRLVATVAEGQYRAGSHTLAWKAVGVPSGEYYIRARAGSRTTVKPITLVR